MVTKPPGPLLPVAPIALWLRGVEESMKSLSERSKVSDRSLRRIKNERQPFVTLATVDRVLSVDGTHLREVYPDWYLEAA